MKKSAIALGLVLLALIGIMFWLYASTDAKHLDRQDVIVDIPDTFEK